MYFSYISSESLQKLNVFLPNKKHFFLGEKASSHFVIRAKKNGNVCYFIDFQSIVKKDEEDQQFRSNRIHWNSSKTHRLTHTRAERHFRILQCVCDDFRMGAGPTATTIPPPSKKGFNFQKKKNSWKKNLITKLKIFFSNKTIQRHCEIHSTHLQIVCACMGTVYTDRRATLTTQENLLFLVTSAFT